MASPGSTECLAARCWLSVWAPRVAHQSRLGRVDGRPSFFGGPTRQGLRLEDLAWKSEVICPTAHPVWYFNPKHPKSRNIVAPETTPQRSGCPNALWSRSFSRIKLCKVTISTRRNPLHPSTAQEKCRESLRFSESFSILKKDVQWKSEGRASFKCRV